MSADARKTARHDVLGRQRSGAIGLQYFDNSLGQGKL